MTGGGEWGSGALTANQLHGAAFGQTIIDSIVGPATRGMTSIGIGPGKLLDCLLGSA
jgi:hypothetical protein